MGQLVHAHSAVTLRSHDAENAAADCESTPRDVSDRYIGRLKTRLRIFVVKSNVQLCLLELLIRVRHRVGLVDMCVSRVVFDQK